MIKRLVAENRFKVRHLVHMRHEIGADISHMNIFRGAPNMVRDCSSSGHLKASDTIAANACGGLISDYYPECMIQAPFLANRKRYAPLESALSLVSSRPGKYLNDKNKRGYLVAGAPADLIVIDTAGEWKKICQTWVGGQLVYRSP